MGSIMHSLLFKLIASIALLVPLAASSQSLASELNEEVVQISKQSKFFTTQLETTLYKPMTGGPFPVVVINHGKSMGDPRFQSRYRPSSSARFFLQRGYAVVVPMRQGFSKSEGSYIGGGCNVESNGNAQAEDVKAVLDFVVQQPWAKKDQILVAGQSHGGWTTLAFGQENYPGVRGLINFAGGLKQESCAGWESGLWRAASEYAKNTKIPSLWFYGDNDSYFSSFTYRGMFEKYTSAGGHAELVAFGVFGNDSHAMFGSRSGEAIWQPKVQIFMQKLGLPTDVIFPEFASTAPMPIPAATNFAEVSDVNAVPYIGEKGREGYKNFLTKKYPRAFVVSASGRWSWAEMGDDPLKRALDICRKNSAMECRLYAVDDQVVWEKD
jgi:dienelactone hydrolase